MKSRFLPFLLLVALGGCAVSSTTNGPSTAGPARNASTGLGKAPQTCHARGTGLYELPDPHCSPGVTNPDVTQDDINSTICKSGWTKTIRPPQSVTGPEKQVEMKAYGVTGSSGYELDHLISLELGGAPNSYANYWPETDYTGSHGFYLNPKDKLEGKLKSLVCAGKLSLQEAQREIATDWVSAYHRIYG